MHDQLDFLVPNLTEGRRRALSSREPWNRGNRTAHGFHGFHGFHGSTAHGSTVQPWNRAPEPWPTVPRFSRGTVRRNRGPQFHGSAVEPWAGTVVDGHGSAVEPWAGTVAHGSTAQAVEPWVVVLFVEVVLVVRQVVVVVGVVVVVVVVVAAV